MDANECLTSRPIEVGWQCYLSQSHPKLIVKHLFGAVAQLGEHCLCKAGVGGSSPLGSIQLPWPAAEARTLATQWRLEYNHRRPHSSLGHGTPAAFAASPMPLPSHPLTPHSASIISFTGAPSFGRTPVFVSSFMFDSSFIVSPL